MRYAVRQCKWFKMKYSYPGPSTMVPKSFFCKANASVLQREKNYPPAHSDMRATGSALKAETVENLAHLRSNQANHPHLRIVTT